MKKRVVITETVPTKPTEKVEPMKFGEAMVNITGIIGVKPDFTALNKPTQKENGLRQFKDEKGVYYETDHTKKKDRTVISESYTVKVV